MTGRVRFGDEGERYLTAQSLVERHDLAIRVQPDLHRKIGIDGRNYSSYELGSILPLVPFYALGRLVSTTLGAQDANPVEMLITGLFNPFITALTMVVLYEFCLALGYSTAISWLCTLLYGLATIAWPYSKAFEREPFLAFCLLLATFAIYRFRQTQLSRWFWTASLSLGFLLFSKLANVIVLPFFVGYLCLAIYQAQKTRWISQMLWTCILFGMPIALLIGMQALSNQIRFGSLTDTGLASTWGNPLSYFGISNVVAGLGGMLFSPGKSIFLYSIPVLLFVFAWVPFFKEHKLEAVFIGLLILVNLVFNAMNVNWEQPSWWGPKYLVPIIPLFLLPLGAPVSRASGIPKRAWLFSLVIAGALGFCVQLVAAFVDDRAYLDVMESGVNLQGALDFLRHGAFESLVVNRSLGSPFHLNPYAVCAGLIAVFLLVWISARIRPGAVGFHSPRRDFLIVLSTLFAIGLALDVWIVVPYPSVLAAQADTKFAAGNSFLADGRNHEALAMYSMAVDGGSHYTREAIARIEELAPRVSGDSLSATDLMNQIVGKESAIVGPDKNVGYSVQASLKVQVPGDQDMDAFAMSDWIAVEPNTTYEFSAWVKTESVYGSGYAAISISEDNGNWKKQRTTDLMSMDETGGWRMFQKSITTLPTTQRFLIRTGLSQTFGTFWVNDFQMAKVTK